MSLSLRGLNAGEDKPLDSIRLSDIIRERSPDENHGPKQVVKIRRANSSVEVVEMIPNAEEEEAAEAESN